MVKTRSTSLVSNFFVLRRFLLLKYLIRIPLQVLLPLLTSLLQHPSPGWFRSQISNRLSLLPLRKDGVRSIIDFLAATLARESDRLSGGIPKPLTDIPGPVLSLEVLDHASKLLASVPSSMTAGEYFAALAPQLLELLDESGTQMQRASAYIIGTGILGKRIYGSPDQVGWKLFAQPILDVFQQPEGTSKGQKTWSIGCDQPFSSSELSLAKAIERLSALTLRHPNPGFVKRLLGRIVLPLWGLCCFTTHARFADSDARPPQLLQILFKTSTGVNPLIRITDELLWDGELAWTYDFGPGGELKIEQRAINGSTGLDPKTMMRDLERRVALFSDMLKTGSLNSEELGSIFMHVSRHWLLGNQTPKEKQKLGGDDGRTANPLRQLIYAKLTQCMIENFQNLLTTSSEETLALIKQILEASVKQKNTNDHVHKTDSNVSRISLRRIVHTGLEVEDGKANEEDLAEIVSAALSLLISTLSSPELVLSPKATEVLTSIRPILPWVSSASTTSKFALAMTAQNAAALIGLQVSTPASDLHSSASPFDKHLEDRKTYQLALTYLQDSLLPVRAEGVSLLTGLVRRTSPVLDVPSTTVLILSLLQDDDEFLYLSAIKTLSLLASKHSFTITKMLVERYVDAEEKLGLDVRIRIGEALLKMIEELGEAFVGPSAKALADGMMAVAGRRGRKSKAAESKAKAVLLRQGLRREAEEAWGGEVPDVSEGEQQDPANVRLARILEGWEGKDGEDDVRIRASALSVLGIAIETNIAGMGSTVVSMAVDLTIAVLKFETLMEKAILRRAAVLLILSVIKAIDNAEEQGRNLGFGLAGENLSEVIDILQYIGATDSDDIVLGHVKVVVDSLEVWQSKRILGVSAIGRERITSKYELNGNHLVGLELDIDRPPTSRPKIEELE